MTQVLNPLKIGKHISRYPIIQAAMAVSVSGAKLASAVALSGGIGVIASLGLGLDSPYFDRRKRGSFFTANRLALIDELAKARSISPDGVIGVNILVATKDYSVLAKTAAEEGANLIITSAGLPLTLPEYTADYPDVALVPTVSNLQAVELICQTWQSQYNRLPDARAASLCHANLDGACLCRANLNRILEWEDLPTDLTEASLQGADLSYANLSGAILRKANLKAADLTGAILIDVDLEGAIMPDGTVHN